MGGRRGDGRQKVSRSVEQMQDPQRKDTKARIYCATHVLLFVYCITLVGCNAAATLVTGRKEQTTEPDCISRSELN